MMGCLHEDVLNIGSHLSVSQDLITLINHKELDLVEIDELVLGQIIEPAGSGDDDMRILGRIFDLILVLLERDASEVAAVAQFWLFEISS